MKIWIEHDLEGTVWIHLKEPVQFEKDSRGWIPSGGLTEYLRIGDDDVEDWIQDTIPPGQLAEFELVCHWEGVE